MQKPPLIASFFALLGLCILLALGTWQIQKYFMLIHDAELCPDSADSRYQSEFDLLHETSGNRCPVTLSGSVFGSPVIPVTQWGEDAESAVSYQIYAYFTASDGSRILTNLGVSDIADPVIDMQNIEVTGVLYKPSGPNRFSPKNNPAENRWYVLNMPQIEEHLKIGDRVAARVSDRVLIAQDITRQDGQKIERFVPAALHKSYLQPGTHLQYTFFWYAMACAFLCIFILRFCRKN